MAKQNLIVLPFKVSVLGKTRLWNLDLKAVTMDERFYHSWFKIQENVTKEEVVQELSLLDQCSTFCYNEGAEISL
jgi:hypothetical protein